LTSERSHEVVLAGERERMGTHKAPPPGEAGPESADDHLGGAETLSDRDQTLTEQDQTLSDRDQTLSDRDQTLSDRDQQASDDDQAASARGGEEGANSASVARTTAVRADTARQRVDTGEIREETADGRDTAAQERDDLAAERDRAAALADEEALRLDGRAGVFDGDTVAAQVHRDRAAAARLRAADDREHAARDRGQAARDREHAARDRKLSAADELTGALRRGAGLEELQQEIDRARRIDAELTVAYVDVDDLKSRNDREGHHAGDQLLRDVADALTRQMRSYDLLVRLGGDEFLCVLPGVGLSEARRRVEQLGSQLHVGNSVSFGLSELREGDSLQELIARADGDLLAARSHS